MKTQIQFALPDGTTINVPETGSVPGWKVAMFPPDPEPYFEHDGQRYRVVSKDAFAYAPFSDGPVEVWRLELVEVTN